MILSVRAVKGSTIRISELNRTTQVPVATIKYYLREGLLPPGKQTAPNQADYTDRHVDRLRLVRVLREIGDLSIEAIGAITTALDNPALSRHQLLGIAHRAISPFEITTNAEELEDVDRLLERLEWNVSADAPDRHGLAHALASLRSVGGSVAVDTFIPYAQAADTIAAMEIAGMPTEASSEQAIEYTVVGTVVYGAALTALRRLAQEHHSAKQTHATTAP